MTGPWPKVPLGEAGEWLSGGTPSKKKPELWVGRIPWVSPKDMKVSRIKDALDHVADSAIGNGTKLIPAGTLLMVVRGMILAHTFPVALNDVDVAFNQDIKSLRINESFDPEYLLYWLQGNASEILKLVEVANHGTKRLPTERLFALPVSQPPIPEQRKIAAILSAADELIEQTEAVIEQLQVVKKAMMQELLTRGLPGRHTRFKKTEIGEIPESWEVLAIGDVVECCDYGLSAKLSQDATLTPILRMGNIQDGEVVLDDLKYIDDDLPRKKGLYLEPGDVLFNRTNSLALVGKVALFQGASYPITFASYLLRMKVRQGKANSQWLNYVLNTFNNQERLRALATPGVSQANINRSRLLQLTLAVPSIDEQIAIGNGISVLDSQIAAEDASVRSLRRVKSALMSVLLTGEVRVTPDEASP